MKKFIVFIFTLLFLILSEYYFLTEIFTQKRVPVIVLSLLSTIVCIGVFIRFFKRTVISS